jgi:hypothetical protein
MVAGPNSCDLHNWRIPKPRPTNTDDDSQGGTDVGGGTLKPCRRIRKQLCLLGKQEQKLIQDETHLHRQELGLLANK